MTIGRAWCGDCTEWCYPRRGGLCIRGESSRLRDEQEALMTKWNKQGSVGEHFANQLGALLNDEGPL
jgi:hypothetical protein